MSQSRRRQTIAIVLEHGTNVMQARYLDADVAHQRLETDLDHLL